MKKYRLTRTHYIDNALMPSGHVIEREDGFLPSEFMEEVKDEPKPAPEPDPVLELKDEPKLKPEDEPKSGFAAVDAVATGKADPHPL
jgi:hypothetical protein